MIPARRVGNPEEVAAVGGFSNVGRCRLYHPPSHFSQWWLMLKRVVVTGMAGISPIGNDWQQVAAALKAKSTGIQYYAGVGEIQRLEYPFGRAVLISPACTLFHENRPAAWGASR